MWCHNFSCMFFRFVTKHAFDGRIDRQTDGRTDGWTDGQNHDPKTNDDDYSIKSLNLKKLNCCWLLIHTTIIGLLNRLGLCREKISGGALQNICPRAPSGQITFLLIHQLNSFCVTMRHHVVYWCFKIRSCFLSVCLSVTRVYGKTTEAITWFIADGCNKIATFGYFHDIMLSIICLPWRK